jgi:hypothetical protein
MVPGGADDFVPRVGELFTALPAGLRQFAVEARAHAAQLESGQAQLHRPATPAPEPEPVVQIERERVYALAPIRWRESDQVRCCPRFGYADLPVDLIERAIDANLVDRLDSPRTRKMIEGFGICNGPADPSQSVDLDTLLDQPAVEEQPSTSFVEKVGRRAGFWLMCTARRCCHGG